MAKAHTLLSVNFLTDRKPICNGILQDAFCIVDRPLRSKQLSKVVFWLSAKLDSIMLAVGVLRPFLLSVLIISSNREGPI